MIQNQGEMDIRALTLLGVSSKRNDKTKIGIFGSGNKYALATFLRHDIPVRVFIGEEEVHIHTKKIEFRDQEYDEIYLTYKDEIHNTGFTVQAGPQWIPWYGIREVYCNALDEGGVQTIPNTSIVAGSAGNTRFFIGITEIVETILKEWNKYFCRDRMDMIDSYPGLNIYAPYGPGLRIYRKGILVYEDDIDSCFDYELEDVAITETRVLENEYEAQVKIMTGWAEHADSHVLLRMLAAIDKACRKDEYQYEKNFYNWTGLQTAIRNNASVWESVTNNNILINSHLMTHYPEECNSLKSFVVPGDLLRTLTRANVISPSAILYGIGLDGEQTNFMELEMNVEQSVMLQDAIRELKRLDIAVTAKFKVVKFFNQRNGVIYAMVDAHRETIAISEQTFLNGLDFLINTLYEEQELHINRRYEDCSRNLQQFLIDNLVKLLRDNLK